MEENNISQTLAKSLINNLEYVSYIVGAVMILSTLAGRGSGSLLLAGMFLVGAGYAIENYGIFQGLR